METNNSFTPSSSGPTEPTPATFHYAGFWIRVLALFIDGVILIIPSLLINMIVPVVGGLITSILYKPFFESSALQATPGKALMGLRVVNLQGGRISFKQSFIRYVSTLLSSALLMIGYLMAAFTERKQALHDLIADTLVIYQAPPSINYLDAWINEVQRAFGFTSTVETAATHSSSGSNDNPLSKIEELHELLVKGVLTEEEYRAKKEELLKRV